MVDSDASFVVARNPEPGPRMLQDLTKALVRGVFADSRKLPEEGTYRFLSAASVHDAPLRQAAYQPADNA